MPAEKAARSDKSLACLGVGGPEASPVRLLNMSLTWGGIKRLVRLQAVADQLAVMIYRDQAAAADFRSLSVILDELIDEAHEALRDADPDLTEEFERIVVTESTAARLPLAARATLLASWLDGTVEAETMEVRIRMGDDRRRRGTLVSSAGNGD